jgi:hypothetical protein
MEDFALLATFEVAATSFEFAVSSSRAIFEER